MTQVYTIVTEWSGGLSDLAVTRLNFTFTAGGTPATDDIGNLQGACNSYYASLESLVPSSTNFEVQQVTLAADVASGTPSADLSSPGPYGAHAGTDGGSFTRGSGLRMNFSTATILDGRHVHGGHYIVPAADSAFNSAGEPSNTTLTLMATEGSDLITGAVTEGFKLVIWSKPRAAKASYTKRGITYPAVTARTGAVAVVTDAEASHKPAGLRKRR